MTTGMVIMRPTSIVVAGGGTETASIRAAGGVEFANATSLSLNGVFTSDYDDYMIVIRSLGTTLANISARLRTSGSDATGSDYTRQFLDASNTVLDKNRQTSQTSAALLNTDDEQRSGGVGYLYGPYLSQPTAMRGVNANGHSGAYILDNACTHSLSTSYDGITLILASGSFGGLVTVYGLAQ